MVYKHIRHVTDCYVIVLLKLFSVHSTIWQCSAWGSGYVHSNLRYTLSDCFAALCRHSMKPVLHLSHFISKRKDQKGILMPRAIIFSIAWTKSKMRGLIV